MPSAYVRKSSAEIDDREIIVQKSKTNHIKQADWASKYVENAIYFLFQRIL